MSKIKPTHDARSDANKRNDVTLSRAQHGGYVVSSACGSSYVATLAAFTTLPEALKWIGENLE
jgi:hypothetical protein